MAHYVAELIHYADNATPDGREQARSACAQAILDLWKHRHSITMHRKPLASFQSTLDFLNALANHTYRIQEPDLENEENPWLSVAARIDCVSGSLLRFCLMQAIKKAAASETEWLESTVQIQLDDDTDSKLIRILLATRSEPTCGSQQARQDLEEFAVLACEIKQLLTEAE
ncbi:MAG: hypothetical protein P9F19_01280 [Candidatus Contendobacter sp.]|nr:hypothetical protein [Candidatus Contendobacter sp.]MDG4556021.1 hypothetical protein [Candidatus Contendobacter sp.]